MTVVAPPPSTPSISVSAARSTTVGRLRRGPGVLAPRSCRARVRSSAAVGGLAVLLTGSTTVGPPPAAVLRSSSTATSALAAGLGLTAADASSGAVARTGGRR